MAHRLGRVPPLPKALQAIEIDPSSSRNNQGDIVDCKESFPRLQNMRLSRDDFMALLKICSSLKDETSCQIQAKLNAFVGSLVDAEICFLLFPSGGSQSFRFKVMGEKELREPYEFPLTEAQISNLTLKKRILHTGDFSDIQLKLFRKWILKDAQTMLFVPIVHTRENGTSKTLFLSCAVNKSRATRPSCPGDTRRSVIRGPFKSPTLVIPEFGESDIKIIQEVFSYATTIIVRNLSFEEEKTRREKCDALLEIAQNLLSFIDDPDGLLKELVEETKDLLNAEKCSVYLVDKKKNQLVGKVIDGMSDKEASKIRLDINKSLLGQVQKSGRMINVPTTTLAQGEGSDEQKTKNGKKRVEGARNFLMFPIKHGDQVVAVVEVCNKKNDFHFKSYDEELAASFSIYYAMSII